MKLIPDAEDSTRLVGLLDTRTMDARKLMYQWIDVDFQGWLHITPTQVSCHELAEYPRRGGLDGTDLRKVGEEAGAGEDDGIVADDATERDEEEEEVEVQPATGRAPFLRDPMCKEAKSPGRVEGDGHVREGEEQQKDVIWMQVARSLDACAELGDADGSRREQDEHGDGRSDIEIERQAIHTPLQRLFAIA